MFWTNFLISFGFTRDSVTWFLGKWASVIVLLASLGADLSHYGIPATWVPKLQLLALIVGVFSAQQSSSNLPGKKDWP